MAERPAGRPSHVQHESPSVEEEKTNDMEWVPATSLAMAAADATSDFHDPTFVTVMRADSSLTAEQLRSRASSPKTLRRRTNRQLVSFRAGLTRSTTKNTDADSADLPGRHMAQGAQETEIGGQDQGQGSHLAEVATPRQRLFGAGPAQRAPAGSQSNTSSTPAQSIRSLGNTFENVDAGLLGGRFNQWLPRHGSLQPGSAFSQHSLSSQTVNQLCRVSPQMAVLPNDSPLQSTSSSIPRRAESRHDHLLRIRPRYDSSLPMSHHQDILLHETESSGDDEDPEEMYSRYRKRRRGAVSSHTVATAETQRLEQQLMSNLSPTHCRVITEVPGARLNRNSIIPRNFSSPLRRLNLDAATEFQNALGGFSNTRAVRNNLPRDDDEMILQMTTRRELDELRSSSALHLPPRLPLGCKSILFLSEIFPRSFGHRKRSALLKIFQINAPYVPSCINLATGLHSGIQYHVCSPSTLRRQQTRLPLNSNGRGWPSNSLPLEVFNIVADFLPRDSLQSMRLVNHEFESKISNTLFHTVVVAFRPEIYGMMMQNSSKPKSVIGDIKGKRKESRKKPGKSLHDGMRTFQGWGPHIKKFAMAFEVDEPTLWKPPIKGKFETHPTFWGQYKWPHPHYNRFEFCEGLEKKADEFRCMSAALSNLTGVTELALSIDSGLGWLNGPDLSDRAQLFREKPRIFGKNQQIPDALSQERQNIWEGVLESASRSQTRPEIPNEHGFFEATVEWQPNMDFQLPARPSFRGQSGRPVVQTLTNRPLVFGGVDVRPGALDLTIEERSKDADSSRFAGAALIPNALSPSQQEWLLETEWAQRAFISSFCMALCDNSQTFRMVTTLNIARLSSRYLPSFHRTDIWLALKKLENLTINVSADWRNITKSEIGIVDAPSIKPSTAAGQFYDLLRNHVSGLQSIRKLSIGYVGGGEHQTGIYGRNMLILPAPVMDFSDPALLHSVTTVSKSLLLLPHIEDLTFSNCWFTPRMFTIFCTSARLDNLKALRLNSVSLTSHHEHPAAVEELSTELGTSIIPQGRPRYGDPSVANFFDLRPDNVSDPSPSGWATTPQRNGSWGNVIDFVTPGANLDFVRYAFQYYDRTYFDSLKHRNSKNLESITFQSCGYVCLANFKEFNQAAVATAHGLIPPFLVQRASDLASYMMVNEDDKLLGKIVPSFPPEEMDVLETGFPMQFGWTDEATAAQCLEDAQPLGGSGRFSGKVQRLTFPYQS